MLPTRPTIPRLSSAHSLAPSFARTLSYVGPSQDDEDPLMEPDADRDEEMGKTEGTTPLDSVLERIGMVCLVPLDALIDVLTLYM